MPSSFLAGLTILDLAAVGPAARASRILADYGMDVIKVAPVTSKSARQVNPVFHAYGAGRGTKQIRIDLKSDQGKEAVLKLAGNVDVIMESYRPGVAERLGVGYEDIRSVNPKIVYCSTSGYGQEGPYAQWAGHDINYLAVGGFLACSGRDGEGLPAIPGATVADSAGGGMHAAMAIVSALLNRFRNDKGVYLDVAATDGVLSLMSLYLDQYSATGVETQPKNSVLTGAYAWYGIYGTKDGGSVSVGAIEAHFFKNLCRLLELEQYADSQYELSIQVEMRNEFKKKFLTQDRNYWTNLLAAENTCMAPVLSIAEVVQDEHLISRNTFMKANHPTHGRFSQLAPILAGCERRQPEYQVKAAGETNTDEVLAAAYFNEEDIARLKKSGAVE